MSTAKATGSNPAALNAPLQAFIRAIVAEAELKGKRAGKRRPDHRQGVRGTKGLAATDAFEEASTGLDRRSGFGVRWG